MLEDNKLDDMAPTDADEVLFEERARRAAWLADTGDRTALAAHIAQLSAADTAALLAVTALLGPLTILAMGGVVFVVALGLLLPMQQLSSQIRSF